MTSGSQVLSASGVFSPAGPNVIYVVRTISERDVAALKQDRIELRSHTSYRMPADTALTINVLRKLEPIGAVVQ
ncbi:MAG: hypothetical protein HKN14_01295 [Marinicaulis sp.]|nr:hypothetical protein [Marinicaulis sp.]NNE39532.1 hypothetical protein [Marinicaulis sp.]